MLVNPRGLLLVLPLLTPIALPAISAAETPANLRETYGKVPLQFEQNRAQADKAVRFLAHGPGYSLYLTSKDAVLVLAKPSEKANDEPSEAVALRMSVVGARSTTAVTGVDELPGKANYFIGNDPAQWRTNVPTYAKVRYSGVYPGIDLVYYGQQRQLEYDFVVAPGADPDQITLGFTGANDIEIDTQGELVLHTTAGEVRQHKPIVYQETDGIRRRIEGRYVRNGETGVGFKVAEYDRARPLVIDPVLVYSTYLGGSDWETAAGIALDNDGNVYVTGLTQSSDFPTTPGAIRSPGASWAVYVSKLNTTGSAVVYSAYFGGIVSPAYGEVNVPKGIAVDSDHNVYVTGGTTSPTFPTTEGALRRNLLGDGDAFVTKLNANGSALVYSTYLGGSANDGGNAIALDGNRNAYVMGRTVSFDFPTTAGAFQTSLLNPPDAFVTKLDPSGGKLVYSTFLGGGLSEAGAGIAVDASGEAYVVNSTVAPDFPTTAGAFQAVLRGDGDAFVTKLSATGSALVYSTYLGGAHAAVGGAVTHGTAISIDSSGHAYVTGWTTSSDFPVTPGAFQMHNAGRVGATGNSDAFVTKLDPSGSSLVYSTYLGGADDDGGSAIAVDVDGNVFVAGSTSSTDFPISRDTCPPGLQGILDAFVTMLDPDGSAVVYSTYLGGSADDSGNAIAVDSGGNAYVAGVTGPRVPPLPCPQCTDDFPTTPHAFQRHYGGGQRDAFVVKIAELPLPQPATSTANISSPTAMPSAAASVADSGQSAGTGGGGAFDWLTLSALFGAAALVRRRRAER